MNSNEIKQSNSRVRRKEEAIVHNTTLDYAANLFPIGECSCSGELMMYLASKEENMYNIYCSKCELIRDFRKIDTDKKIKLLYPLASILDMLVKTYGEDLIEETQYEKPERIC